MFTEMFIRSCGAISGNKRSCFSVGLFDCRGYLNVFKILSFFSFHLGRCNGSVLAGMQDRM